MTDFIEVTDAYLRDAQEKEMRAMPTQELLSLFACFRYGDEQLPPITLDAFLSEVSRRLHMYMAIEALVSSEPYDPNEEDVEEDEFD